MKYIITIFSCCCIFTLACKKQDEWLDKKSNKADITPTTLEDCQALLDNDAIMNANYPALGIIGTDNFYVTFDNWQAAPTAVERNAYLWADDVYEGRELLDWNAQYQKVEYANVVIDALENIEANANSQAQWNGIKGAAMFHRAFAFYNLVQLFAKPYIDASARTDLGIPLRLSSDVNIKSTRSTVYETYDRIIKDLKEAENLLPSTTGYKTRPTKTAVQALLARVYLVMEDYDNAKLYAQAALTAVDTLIHFKDLSTTANFPFPTFRNNNPEVIFHAQTILYLLTTSLGNRAIVDSALFESYKDGDLRKTIFYRVSSGVPVFKGQYTAGYNFFGGLATNELYLILAEANARMGKKDEAMTAINTLLQKRWESSLFVPLSALDAEDALKQIIAERRKELPFTGCLRWEDLRRLNKESNFATTIVRKLNGQTYTLAPNDEKYVFPIPDDEIRLSGIQQNPR
jgi:SusD family.